MVKGIGGICLQCERWAIQPALRPEGLRRPKLVRPATGLLHPVRRITLRAQIESRERKKSVVRQDSHNVPPSDSVLPHDRGQKQSSVKESSEALQHAKAFGTAILSNRDTVPKEQDVIAAMEACEEAAGRLMSSDTSADSVDPASALLLLSGRRNDHAKPYHPASLAISIDLLSNLAHKILLHPTVFISPELLQRYVVTQSLLQRPESFPEVFTLYATKDRPKPGTLPVQFTKPNPNSHTSAIPADTAKLALQAAIRSKDMDLSLEVIRTTFRTLAWQRYKILTRAAVPIAGLSLAPIGAYTLASQFALLPSAADPSNLTMVAFGGGLTYLFVVGSMGFIALTTANDQMKRVTWALGTPLRERWVREEERAAMDQVVLGFGFSEAKKAKWGDETGPEWEYLKEWIGQRGCVVDRVELMEGME